MTDRLDELERRIAALENAMKLVPSGGPGVDYCPACMEPLVGYWRVCPKCYKMHREPPSWPPPR